MVSSAVGKEGKSTVTLNLAAACAEAGDRVLVIDADLRRPSLATALGIEGAAGLTSVLTGRATFDEVVQHNVAIPLLDVLASGPLPPNPTQLLGSTVMGQLLMEVRGLYDIVLMDSPPLLPVVDAAVLARGTGGVILIAGTSGTRRDELRAALQSVDDVGVRPLGIVVNGVTSDPALASRYAYGSDGGEAEQSATS